MDEPREKAKPIQPLEDWQQLLHLTGQIANKLYAEEGLSAAVQMLHSVLKCQTVAVVTIEPDTEYMRVKASRGLSATFVKRFRRATGTGVIGEVIWGGFLLLLRSIDRDSAEYADLKLEHDFASATCVPITINNRNQGYLFADSPAPSHFSERDFEFLQLVADLIALAIDKSAMYARNRELTMHDEKSCCYSYSYFYQRLTEELDRAKALKEKCSLLLLDVDNFKRYSEVHGLEAGEKLFADLAQTVKDNLRVFDVIGLYGRDEIIAYLPRTDREWAVQVAEQVRQAVEARYRGQSPAATVSIGIATLLDHGQAPADLLRAAQVALIQAQRQGRNRVVVAGL